MIKKIADFFCSENGGVPRDLIDQVPRDWSVQVRTRDSQWEQAKFGQFSPNLIESD